jgi:hypothetical protein
MKGLPYFIQTDPLLGGGGGGRGRRGTVKTFNFYSHFLQRKKNLIFKSWKPNSGFVPTSCSKIKFFFSFKFFFFGHGKEPFFQSAVNDLSSPLPIVFVLLFKLL